MLYRIELCNLSNPSEKEIVEQIIGSSTFNSEHTLQVGKSSQQYFDFDSYLSNRQNADILLNLLARKIKVLEKDSNERFDKIAFVEQEEGPTGLMAINNSLSKAVQKDSLIVRLRKKLYRSGIKGAYSETENVLIISDVATTGDSIFKAATKLRAVNISVSAALVIVDRLQGGTENLSRKGIQLYSITSIDSLISQFGDLLGEKHLSFDAPLEFSDFGGVSIINKS